MVMVKLSTLLVTHGIAFIIGLCLGAYSVAKNKKKKS